MSIWEKSWEIYRAGDECYASLVKMRKVKHSEARDGPWRSWRCHRGRSAELNFRRYPNLNNLGENEELFVSRARASKPCLKTSNS